MLNTDARCASAIAIPTAIAIPCPSGPVVASTPTVCPYSGCPGVKEPNCLKFLTSSSERLPIPKRWNNE